MSVSQAPLSTEADTSRDDAYDRTPELVFAFVAPIGPDLSNAKDELARALRTVGYGSIDIKLTDELGVALEAAGGRLAGRAIELVETPEHERIDSYMDAGNALREEVKSGDAMALLGVAKIRSIRRHEAGDEKRPLSQVAYVVRSLKHPGEATLLRRLYGSRFFLIGVHAPRRRRIDLLSSRFASSVSSFDEKELRDEAERLVQRDESEPGTDLGQNVRQTFWRADAFVGADDLPAIDRIVKLLFGHPGMPPTRDEMGMAHATIAAGRSASLARQVGAVAYSQDGSAIATGTNDVPRPGGGLYWTFDADDARDHIKGYDISDRLRTRILDDLLERLRRADWLSEGARGSDVEVLIDEVLKARQPVAPPFGDSRLLSLIEFTRAVHAEMDVITTAARLGLRLQGSTLYSTTFPCHECARHIIAAGIRRVVYVEPYAKSLIQLLHSDAVVIEGPENSGRIPFEPFVGIGPQRFGPLFKPVEVERKGAEGNIVDWPPVSGAEPVLEPADYSPRWSTGPEAFELNRLPGER